MKRSQGIRLVLLGAGLLLILLGMRGVVLSVAGESVQAEVTNVTEAADRQDDPTDRNYSIAYRFSVDNRDYSGSYTCKRVYNTANLPTLGDAVTVRYLPPLPAINAGPDTGMAGGSVMGVLGLLLLVCAAKPSRATRMPARAKTADTVLQS